MFTFAIIYIITFSNGEAKEGKVTVKAVNTKDADSKAEAAAKAYYKEEDATIEVTSRSVSGNPIAHIHRILGC